MAQQASGQRSGLGQLELWGMLVVVLSLLGVAGAISYALLQQVTEAPTVTDVAQRVCTAYTEQNYQLLISQIDPTPVTDATPISGSVAVTGPFDSTLKNELISQLKTLDINFGPVTDCQQHQLVSSQTSASPPKVHFIFEMHRSGTPHVTYSYAMIFVERSGGWMITRDSNFTGTPS